MARRRNISEKEAPKGSFTVLFTSLSMILLAFFILLTTMSVIDERKKRQALGSLLGSFGLLDGNTLIKRGDASISLAGLDKFFKDKLGRERNPENVVKHYISTYKLHDDVIAKVIGGNLRITLRDRLLFDLGKAELKDELKPLLRIIARIIRDEDLPSVIEGHTDDLPIHSETYPSNWELSTSRAVNILRYLVEEEGADPMMVYARGLGEYHPEFPNDSDENRSRNRRVVIILEGGGESGKLPSDLGANGLF